MLLEMEAQASYSDTLGGELAKEVENGRLLRLLVRLSMVTERPEGDMDPQWSETGMLQALSGGELSQLVGSSVLAL